MGTEEFTDNGDMVEGRYTFGTSIERDNGAVGTMMIATPEQAPILSGHLSGHDQ
jgi:hypothetical protein